MLEKTVEKYLVKRVEALGGTAYKFTSPQRRNVPDRLVVFPGNLIFFVEVKAPGKKPTDGQLREHKRLQEKGARVYVVDSREQINKLLINFE